MPPACSAFSMHAWITQSPIDMRLLAMLDFFSAIHSNLWLHSAWCSLLPLPCERTFLHGGLSFTFTLLEFLSFKPCNLASSSAMYSCCYYRSVAETQHNLTTWLACLASDGNCDLWSKIGAIHMHACEIKHSLAPFGSDTCLTCVQALTYPANIGSGLLA